MKSFLKTVIASIIAIFISSILLLVIIIVGIGILTSKNTQENVVINENSVLNISLKNKIIDSDTESEMSIFNYKKGESIKLQDIILAIEKAKNDDNIKGISIESDKIEAGTTQLDAIRKSIENFKKSGKFVYAYGNNVSQPAYYLGSVADKYFLNPTGGIELKGLSSEIVFFKEFSEKYGININVIRQGKFKAAVEPYLRNDISPENREQLSTLLNDIWQEISTKIMISRKLSQAEFNTIVDNLYGVIPNLSLEYKLVDQLAQKSEYDNFLKSILKINTEEEINKISIGNYIKTLDEDNFSLNKIAVLHASGTIYNGNEVTNIHSERYIKYIDDLIEDDNIKAVVLHVNSPGGSANASDEILFKLQQLKQKKPLIVSFGDYAASGGYYISMAADKIFAQNNSITGSIGVFGIIPDIKKLANNNGIRADVVSTNTNSNMLTPISGISSGTVSIMQKSVESIYKRFIHFVSLNRKMTLEKVDAIGGGRVWSGKRAKEIGLVDEIGDLNDAIKFAANKAKITDDYQVENYPYKVDKLEQLFGSIEEKNIIAKYIKHKIGEENFKLFEMYSEMKLQNNVQMVYPFTIKF